MLIKAVTHHLDLIKTHLLDTNIIIALFADEAVVKSNLAQADEIHPSILIVLLQLPNSF